MSRTVTEILEELETTSSRLDKEEILELNRKNTLLKEVLFAGLDQTTPHNVGKVKATPKRESSWESSDEAIKDFLWNVLPQLKDRSVTGNAAKDLVKRALCEMNATEQKWATRILLKRLRIGVQESTVAKIWPGLVKKFAVQLAHSLKTEQVPGKGVVILEEVSFPVRTEPKLDGLRLIARKSGGTVSLSTRNGTALGTLPELVDILELAPYDDIVLDGEIMGADWNESASVAMSRVNQKDESGLIFNVFDAVPVAQWDAQDCAIPYSLRLKTVANVVRACNHKRVCQVQGTDVKNLAELWEQFDKRIAEGYEGIMLKDVSAPYHFKRTRALRKLKPVMTFEGVICGIKEGRAGSKREGLFGGFEVIFPTGAVTDVGGGFTDKLLAEIGIDPEVWIGRIIEVEGQPDPATDNGFTVDGKVRFPVFIRQRSADDVDPAVVTAYEKWIEENRR